MHETVLIVFWICFWFKTTQVLTFSGDKDLCDTYGEEVTTSYEDDDENNERENYDLRVESAEREISMRKFLKAWIHYHFKRSLQSINFIRIYVIILKNTFCC